MTEGPFDWLALRAGGYPAVALGGAACSRAHLGRLAAFRRVVLLLDRDDAGDRAAAAPAGGPRRAGGRAPPCRRGSRMSASWPRCPTAARRLAAVLDGLIDSADGGEP